jgi:hypothetical protein
MQKKFKQTPAAELPASAASPSLAEYIQAYAPQVLADQDFMQGAPALDFWQALFQAQQPGEGKRPAQEVLRWPYAERLVYLAREFLKLDARSQAYVRRAAQARIWWRGDDIRHFRHIVAAQQRYRRLGASEQAAYRKQLLRSAEKLGVRLNA